MTHSPTRSLLPSPDLPAKAREIGAAWKIHLQRLAQKYEVIGDVRGRGLIQGVEFVKDRMSKAPFFAMGSAVYQRCLQAGLLFSVRRKGSVIRFVPPFTTTSAQLGQAADILDQAIAGSLDILTRTA